MLKKFLTMFMSATVLVSALAACSGSSNSDSDKVYHIGGLAPLTGGVSVYGISTNQGVELAIEEINAAGGIDGKTIKYTVMDEKGDVTEAVNAYDLLVTKEKVDAVIGDVTSKPTIAVAERAAEDGMPLITPTGTLDAITGKGASIFRTCFTDSFQGQAMAEYLKDASLDDVAILYDNGDDYSVAVTEAFTAKAEELGLTMTAKESFSSGDSDFKAQLTKIVSANPKVLFVPSYYETNALILRQAREAGFEGLICGGDGWDGILTQFKDDVSVPNGVIFSTHYSMYDEDEKVQNFVKAYKEKYKEEPTSFSALGYDTVYMLKAAVEKAKSSDKAAVTEAIKGLEFSGVTGSFTFDKNNNPVKTVSYVLVNEGKYELDSKK